MPNETPQDELSDIAEEYLSDLREYYRLIEETRRLRKRLLELTRLVPANEQKRLAGETLRLYGEYLIADE